VLSAENQYVILNIHFFAHFAVPPPAALGGRTPPYLIPRYALDGR
jgi:hypothetical protein